MKWEKQLGSRQVKVPAPCSWHLDASSGHSQGNGSFDICGPPTQPVSCSADVDGHSLFQLSHPGSESRITVVTAFPDVGSCSSPKEHMHVHIPCFPKVALGSTFHQLQQAAKQEVGDQWAAVLICSPVQEGAGQPKHEGGGACPAFVRVF